MSNHSRRDFISTTGKVALAGSTGIFAINSSSVMTAKNMFIHHVYFWLKNPANIEEKAKLLEGLKKLSKVNTIKDFYISQPATTRRDVIDSSYDVSWLLFFDSAADQDSYQTDPIHLKFVEECSSLWKKVTVYDSIDANP